MQRQPGQFRTIAQELRFPEGPVCLPDGSILVVEIEGKTLARVSSDGAVARIAYLGGGPNGMAVGPDGRIYVCNNGGLTFIAEQGRLRPVLQADDYTGGCI